MAWNFNAGFLSIFKLHLNRKLSIFILLILISTPMRKIILFLLLSAGLCNNANAQIQSELDTFNSYRRLINIRGMSLLTAWSAANVIGGSYGYFTADEGQAKHFQGMNAMWGGINLIFGLAGLIQANSDHKKYDFNQTVRQQHSIEKTFLFNAGLDLAYIAGGFYLLENAKVDHDHEARYKGWGTSIIMQGAFLCLFDAGMFISHNTHGKKKLDPIIQRATFVMSGDGVGIRYRF
jgi:hypothetical protein